MKSKSDRISDPNGIFMVFFIHAFKYIACKMCTVLNMVHIYI